MYEKAPVNLNLALHIFHICKFNLHNDCVYTRLFYWTFFRFWRIVTVSGCFHWRVLSSLPRILFVLLKNCVDLGKKNLHKFGRLWFFLKKNSWVLVSLLEFLFSEEKPGQFKPTVGRRRMCSESTSVPPTETWHLKLDNFNFFTLSKP